MMSALLLWFNVIHISGISEVGYPAEVGALFTTVSSIRVSRVSRRIGSVSKG